MTSEALCLLLGDRQANGAWCVGRASRADLELRLLRSTPLARALLRIVADYACLIEWNELIAHCIIKRTVCDNCFSWSDCCRMATANRYRTELREVCFESCFVEREFRICFIACGGFYCEPCDREEAWYYSATFDNCSGITLEIAFCSTCVPRQFVRMTT